MKDKINKNERTPLTTCEWTCELVLLCIPVIGHILAIIWGFSSTQNLNLKNFSRAFLIVTTLLVVIGLIFAGIYFHPYAKDIDHAFGAISIFIETLYLYYVAMSFI